MADTCLQELHERYADDSDEEQPVTSSHAAPAPEPAKHAAHTQQYHAAEAGSAAADEDIDEDSDWTEDYDEDGLDAEDWAEARQGHLARGHHAGAYSGMRQHPNAAGGSRPSTSSSVLQPVRNQQQRLAAAWRLSDDPLEGLGGVALGAGVANSIRAGAARAATGRVTRGDKSDRATVEQALDPRTRMVLFKMLNRGVFSQIHGVVSTGKEANVYAATAPDGSDRAIKVYKTSILVFKDRDRYVSGDFRFRTGYCRSNPRKMVAMWAEKEMRNLVRLRAAGVRAPEPLLLRTHVLVMEFIGTNGVAAPRLRDAGLPLQRLCSAYGELLVLLRRLYQDCRLVHADLSEYNILVHQGELVLIDVSQAVDLDHPKALDFLREDAAHINAFFRRAGVAVLTNRELFDFAVDASITRDSEEGALAALQARAASRPLTRGAEEEVEEAVFAAAFIPRRLGEVTHYERDREALAAGQAVEGLYYATITGMQPDLSGPRHVPLVLQEEAVQQQQQQQQEAGSSRPDSNPVPHPARAAAAAAAAAGGDADQERRQSSQGVGTSRNISSIASPDSEEAAERVKAKRGKGPSFMAFLPKAEHQGPMPAASKAAPSSSGGGDAGALQPAAAPPPTTPPQQHLHPATLSRQRPDTSKRVMDGAGRCGGSTSSDSGSSSSSDSEDGSSDGDGEGAPAAEGDAPVDREAARVARKEHKRAIKEANRERRKTKVPKHVKKAHKTKNKKK